MPKARSGSSLLEGALIFRGFPKLRSEALAGLRGLCDLAETAFLEPSCNTDQGVKQTRKGEDIVASTSLVLKGRCERIHGVHF